MKRQALHLIVAASLVLGAAGLQAQEALRPDVGKPLQAAQELIKGQKFKEALAKVREAEAVPNKSANESYLIERMRIAAASGAGEVDTAAKSYEILKASGKLPAAEQLRMLESLTGSYYRAKDYAKAVTWGKRYLAEGGTNGQIRTLVIQSQYLSGDYAGATKELVVEVQADEKAGRVPAEDRLKLLLNAAQRVNDNASYVLAMERLVTHYPKKEYWGDLLARVQRKPNFSDRLTLDTYRLMLASNSMRNANDYMEMAQLAVQAGLSGEGKQVVEKGFAAGVLGTGTPSEADRHRRLKDLVTKRADEEKQGLAARQTEAAAAKAGNELVDVGFSQVFLGEPKKGIALMEQGIAKGGLKRADDAKLHLGIAWLVAGEQSRAQSVFKTVGGADGTADLARLWALVARQK
ncbi:tetratricopeptide repeat protein [Sphaerotilaceae bacterium SBD11-9]